MLGMSQWVIPNKKIVALSLVSSLIICGAFVWLWNRSQQAEERYQQAVVLQQKQFERAEQLAQELHISNLNAHEMQAAYQALKDTPPVASFTVNATNLDTAAERVAERINQQEPSLPAAALEKTDWTAIVKNEQQYKVDVLKINLDKSWEVSAGVGSHHGDIYVPVGLQRNYAPHKSIAVEMHLKTEELAKGKVKTSGWEVRHVWRY